MSKPLKDSVRVDVRLPALLHNTVKAQADAEGMLLSDWIKRAIDKRLDAEGIDPTDKRIANYQSGLDRVADAAKSSEKERMRPLGLKVNDQTYADVNRVANAMSTTMNKAAVALIKAGYAAKMQPLPGI